MRRIYEENPFHWPHGCNMELFQQCPGQDEVFLIKHAGTPVGFTGWQERDEQGVKIGYYAIGILPEHRRNGFARQAVEKLINTKRAGVDRVQAAIVRTNTPSMELAKQLDDVVIKAAAWKPLVGALANAGIWDAYMHRGHYGDTSDLPGRLLMGGVNAALGAGGGHLMGTGKVVEGAGLMALSPVKDLAVSLLPAAQKLPGTIDNLNKTLNAPPAAPALTPKEKLMIAAGIGLGGLGIAGGAYALSRSAKRVADAQDAAAGGRLHVKLPTRDPNDQETTFDVPVGDSRVSPNLVNLMFRDTRRKLRQETKERTWHHGKGKRVLTNAEPLTSEEQEELEKNSAGIKPFSIQPLKAQPFANSIGGGDGDQEKQQRMMDDLKSQQEQQQKEHERKSGDLEQRLQQSQREYSEAKADYEKKTAEMSSELEKTKNEAQKSRQSLEEEHANFQKTRNELEKAHHELSLQNSVLKHQISMKDMIATTGADRGGHHAMNAVTKSVEDLHKRTHKALYKVASMHPEFLKMAVNGIPEPRLPTQPAAITAADIASSPHPGLEHDKMMAARKADPQIQARIATRRIAAAAAPAPAQPTTPWKPEQPVAKEFKSALPTTLQDEAEFMKSMPGSDFSKAVTNYAYTPASGNPDVAYNDQVGGEAGENDPSIGGMWKRFKGRAASSWVKAKNFVQDVPKTFLRSAHRGMAEMGEAYNAFDGWNTPTAAIKQFAGGLLGATQNLGLNVVGGVVGPAISGTINAATSDWKTPGTGDYLGAPQKPTPAPAPQPKPSPYTDPEGVERAVTAYGNTGALSMLNRAGYAIPGNLRGYDPRTAAMLNYPDHPMIGKGLGMLGSWMGTPTPSPDILGGVTANEGMTGSQRLQYLLSQISQINPQS